MVDEVFEAVETNEAKTVSCHCSCLISPAVAQATGAGVRKAMEPPNCSCTCYCQAGQAHNQRKGDTTATTRNASRAAIEG